MRPDPNWTGRSGPFRPNCGGPRHCPARGATEPCRPVGPRQQSWQSWSWRWNPWIAVAHGWAVILPDPALSTGYGQTCIDRAWPYLADVVWGEVEAVLDTVLERPDVDPTRVGAGKAGPAHHQIQHSALLAGGMAGTGTRHATRPIHVVTRPTPIGTVEARP